jgi:hypothetical protein
LFQRDYTARYRWPATCARLKPSGSARVNLNKWSTQWKAILSETAVEKIQDSLHFRQCYPRLLEHWDRGFESPSRHGCLCAFILCLCCSVCR